ncbi:MAG: prenyltransferase/squalene oxidase repeat-containing protein, partial [Rubripirellula sp.]
MSQPLRQRARATLDRLRSELLSERNESGHWLGKLSPSALSTATAISAMSAVLVHRDAETTQLPMLREQIACGIDYLCDQQNSDGGYGDTDRSRSNIATSYLVLAAASIADTAIGRTLPPKQILQLNEYIESAGAIDGLRERYGTDKTFVVPILTNMAIAGLVSWDEVPALPFEAAVFPQSMYRMLSMPVVSYAIPALVAIGQARHFLGRKALLPLRMIRAAAVGRSMKVLQRMQPQSGGYLEATPLTSFVVMSLAATGRGNHPVSQQGIQFLLDSMDEYGSWPIDTNLATWVTSLSMHALSCDPQDDGQWCRPELIRWHLDCQHKRRHPFTGAEPGGWGWSDLSGAVPDSDDTPAAILALGRSLRWCDQDLQKETRVAIRAGLGWLDKLQNRDGGWPTFCRGWGKLPFDRSSNDLTAHALRAIESMLAQQSGEEVDSTRVRYADAFRFLERNQQEDGSWLPLWFGNQDIEDETNPVYGTAKVLMLGTFAGGLSPAAIQHGSHYLVVNQNADGGWGGGSSLKPWMDSRSGIGAPAGLESSVEETALAVEALSTVLLNQRGISGNSSRNLEAVFGVESNCTDQEAEAGEMEGLRGENSLSSTSTHELGGGNLATGQAIIRGIEFLLASVDDGRHREPWPIGFYFAK